MEIPFCTCVRRSDLQLYKLGQLCGFTAHKTAHTFFWSPADRRFGCCADCKKFHSCTKLNELGETWRSWGETPNNDFILLLQPLSAFSQSMLSKSQLSVLFDVRNRVLLTKRNPGNTNKKVIYFGNFLSNEVGILGLGEADPHHTQRGILVHPHSGNSRTRRHMFFVGNEEKKVQWFLQSRNWICWSPHRLWAAGCQLCLCFCQTSLLFSRKWQRQCLR